MRERLRRIRHVLRMKDYRLPKIALFGQPSRAKQKADRLWLGWEDLAKKDLREMRTFYAGAKWETLNRLGWMLT